MMARTCTNNLRVVFSPYVKHCPCEASEQKWGQKTNIWNKEIELRIWFHSIRLNELVILVCLSKFDEKWPSYGHGKRARQSGAGLFWAIRWPFWPHFLRYELQICFAHYLHSFWYTNHVLSQSDPNRPFYPQKNSKNSPKWPYLKTPLRPSVIHQKAYSSYIFQRICLKLSESM